MKPGKHLSYATIKQQKEAERKRKIWEEEQHRQLELEKQKREERKEIEKQKQIELSKRKRKQDEFEEKRQAIWLQFINEEANFKKEEASGYNLTPWYKVFIIALVTLYILGKFVYSFIGFSIYLLPLLLISAIIITLITVFIQEKREKQKNEMELQLRNNLEKEKRRITQKYGETPFDNNNKLTRSFDICYCRSGKSFIQCHGNLN